MTFLPLITLQAAAGKTFYVDSSFWVAFCVVAFIAFVIYKGAGKALIGALDKRTEAITNELEEARRLREEAQALLASYKRKQKEAEAQAENIVAQARHDAEIMAAKAKKDLAERIARRTDMAEAKIAAAEAKALSDVRAKAADVALDAAEKILATKMSSAAKAKLVKSGISSMGDMIN